jgi:hypothetical protein
LGRDKNSFSVKFYQKLAIFCKKKRIILIYGTGDWGLGKKQGSREQGENYLYFPNHQSPITNHQSPITNHQLPI